MSYSFLFRVYRGFESRIEKLNPAFDYAQFIAGINPGGKSSRAGAELGLQLLTSQIRALTFY